MKKNQTIKKTSGKLFYFILSALGLFLLASCATYSGTHTLKMVPDNVHLGPKMPLKAGIKVDREKLNRSFIIKGGSYTIHSPIGRSLFLFYKKNIDMLFEEVNFLLPNSERPKGEFDLVFNLTLEKYEVSLPGTFSLGGNCNASIALNFSIESIEGKTLANRRIENNKTVPCPLKSNVGDNDNMDYINSHLNNIIGKTINEILFKFSREIQGSSLFCVLDIKNYSGLIGRLNDDQNPLSQHIISQMPKNAAEDLKKKKGLSEKKITDFFKENIVRNFNAMIKNKPLYKQKLFQHLALSEEAKELIKRNPKGGDDLIRLNRLLLQAAFKEIEMRDMTISRALLAFKKNDL